MKQGVLKMTKKPTNKPTERQRRNTKVLDNNTKQNKKSAKRHATKDVKVESKIKKWREGGLTLEEAREIPLERRLKIPIEDRIEYIYKIKGKVAGREFYLNKNDAQYAYKECIPETKLARYISCSPRTILREVLKDDFKYLVDIALKYLKIEPVADPEEAVEKSADLLLKCKRFYDSLYYKRYPETEEISYSWNEYLAGILFSKSEQPYIKESYAFEEIAEDFFAGVQRKTLSDERRTENKIEMLDDFIQNKVKCHNLWDKNGNYSPIKNLEIGFFMKEAYRNKKS